MAGASAERQENGFIAAIEKTVKANANNPITLIAGKTKIFGVIGAEKFKGRQASGSEPYTDVVIKVLKNGKIENINCSLKGESAPSLAGGGLKGLELIIPGIAAKFMKAAHAKLSKTIKLGDKVPDVFGKIGRTEKLKIVIGNTAIGGPIDFMYIGKMDVASNYDKSKNILTIRNGEFIPANIYAQTHELYFRLRARREDQRFDPMTKDKAGIPKIYGVSPSKGDSAGRIVITDKVPSSAVIVNI
jgi:hypothetical protein